MVDAVLEHQLSTYMNQLPIDQQRQVVEFARSLTNPKIHGIAGSSLLSFVGCINGDDLKQISQAITESCEGIDADGW